MPPPPSPPVAPGSLEDAPEEPKVSPEDALASMLGMRPKPEDPRLEVLMERSASLQFDPKMKEIHGLLQSHSLEVSPGSGGGGSSEGDRQAVATKEREAGGGSDSGSSSEGQDGRKGYRHKKRAGRMVRERKHGRKRRDGEVGPNRRSMRSNGSSEPWYRAVVASLGQDNIIIHAVRFGLFCAMAWSMNSIIFSVLRLYSSASFPPST
mmetsp:Transcript_112123/g.289717  ORF Transcript_112123/g.289717 Transcript_112123/m.289717 type:complete len:208 (+) Transcript_112123:114-737(+)